MRCKRVVMVVAQVGGEELAARTSAPTTWTSSGHLLGNHLRWTTRTTRAPFRSALPARP